MRLGRDQAQLLRAVLLSGPVPAGFDADRVELTASLLIKKRWRHVSHVRPVLVRSLGPSGRQRFEHHAREHPFRPADAQADALCFFRDLARATELPRDAVREQAVALAGSRRRRRRAVLRRWLDRAGPHLPPGQWDETPLNDNAGPKALRPS